MLVCFLLAIAGAAGWLTLTWPREPTYNGKPLTYWLEHYLPPPTNIGSSYALSDPAAAEAIRRIGTNGIPTLLRLLRAYDSPLKLRLIALAQRQHLISVEFSGGGLWHMIQPAPSKKHQLRIRITRAGARNECAEFGFLELRSTASNAVPSLVEILDANISQSSQRATVSALGDIGPAASSAVPSLVRALTGTNVLDRGACLRALGQIHAQPESALPALVKHLNQRNFVQPAAEALAQFGPEAAPAVPDLISILDRNDADSSRAATTLGQIGPAAKPAIPSLLRGVPKTNRDFEFRLQCILALGRIHQEPELVVPRLTNCISETLRDQDVRVRAFCAEALGQYGTNATPAVPLLAKLLEDQNPNVRRDATNALQRIAPVSYGP